MAKVYVEQRNAGTNLGLKLFTMPSDPDKRLIEQLSRSQIYADYERAFSDATGLPLTLRPLETWQVVHDGKEHQNPFCALMAKSSKSCAACLEVQEELSAKSHDEPCTMTCFAGLTDSAVPVRMGERLVGFLQTGQVLLKKPSKDQFAKTSRRLLDWGLKVDLSQLEEAYFHTRLLKKKEYEAMLRLLTIFGQHLSIVANRLSLQEQHEEPPNITRARQFISERQGDDISLSDVAKGVNMSTFYFCKMFKKATGLTFTDYLSRVRIEKAKNLLLNPNLRVSEVAFEVGFQSLTHFNRVFKKLIGQSPTEYRESLPRVSNAA